MAASVSPSPTVSAPVSTGRFTWVELITPDPEAAIAFYTKIVGWSTEKFGNTGYTMWVGSRGPVGGVMGITPEMRAQGVPPHWFAHVTTPDCDATLRRVSELGGVVRHGPEDIPTVGRFGVFTDPQGAILSAFTPLREMAPPPGEPQSGEFCWHELGTTDPDAAFTFYHEIFGWEKTGEMEMAPGHVYQMYGTKGQSYGGMYRLDPAMKAPTAWLHYVEVPDLKHAADQVPKLGGKIITGPMDVPGGSMLVAGDPQGAVFAVHTKAATH